MVVNKKTIPLTVQQSNGLTLPSVPLGDLRSATPTHQEKKLRTSPKWHCDKMIFSTEDFSKNSAKRDPQPKSLLLERSKTSLGVTSRGFAKQKLLRNEDVFWRMKNFGTNVPLKNLDMLASFLREVALGVSIYSYYNCRAVDGSSANQLETWKSLSCPLMFMVFTFSNGGGTFHPASLNIHASLC